MSTIKIGWTIMAILFIVLYAVVVFFVGYVAAFFIVVGIPVFVIAFACSLSMICGEDDKE